MSEKRDLKAAAIGAATKWLKAHYKDFTLPMKVRRIITSGQYIMWTTVTDGKKTSQVFLKVVDGEVHQTSVKEWNLNESAPPTFKQFLEQEKQEKKRVPAFDPKLHDLENKVDYLKKLKDLKRRNKLSNGNALLKPQAESVTFDDPELNAIWERIK